MDPLAMETPMTDHCYWCPFAACPGCEYQGGAKPPTSVHYSRERERMEGPPNEAAPAGNRGLTKGLKRSHDG